jgi:hypothetical protein
MEDVRQTIDRINSAWRDERFDDLSQYFDENIVMRGPGLKVLALGRDALISSYADFMKKSTVLAYEETNHSIDTSRSTATACYDWSMTWEQNGKQESASGHEMFVFELRDSKWIAVLRLMLF